MWQAFDPSELLWSSLSLFIGVYDTVCIALPPCPSREMSSEREPLAPARVGALVSAGVRTRTLVSPAPKAFPPHHEDTPHRNTPLLFEGAP